MRTASSRSFSALPKIRLWYDNFKRLLHVTPISFAKAGESEFAERCARLKDILTPEEPTPNQRTFAEYQAEALSEQIALLGYLKPFFRKYRLSPKLNDRHIKRYFGPRAAEVVHQLEEGYRSAADLPLPAPKVIVEEPLDFYWVAVEIMRSLGRVYWTQPAPRMESLRMSNDLSQLADDIRKVSHLTGAFTLRSGRKRTSTSTSTKSRRI